jgi:hypothetical protein
MHTFLFFNTNLYLLHAARVIPSFELFLSNTLILQNDSLSDITTPYTHPATNQN